MNITFILLMFYLQPITRKDIELQVVEIPSVIKLERPFSVILHLLMTYLQTPLPLKTQIYKYCTRHFSVYEV